MITKRVSAEFKVFLGLLIIGLVFANIVLIILSLVPFFFVITGLDIHFPRRMSSSTHLSKRIVCLNEVVELRNAYSVEEGVGLVTCHTDVPRHFQLAEGNNFHVFFKGRTRLDQEISFKVKCTRRGLYTIGQSTNESFSALSLDEMKVIQFGKGVELLVMYRSLDPRRMRDPRLTSRIPLPIAAITRIGPLTTDFKEIREYRPGDMFKSINWKATARLTNGEKLMVNEYEREGRRTVWILVDCGPGMKRGTAVQNVFEYAIQAAGGLSDYYLARGCNVGMAFFNHDKVIYPDLGRRQRELVARTLMRIDQRPYEVGIRTKIRSLRGHLYGSSPLFIVITNLREQNVMDIKNGVKDLRKYSGPRATAMVIHVNGNDLGTEGAVDEISATMADMNDLPVLKELRSDGIPVIPWDPHTQSLQRLMLYNMKRGR